MESNNKLKVIKIFIASSNEMKEDREALIALISSLNNFYLDKGIFIKPYIWEDEDSKVNGRKQDEYNQNIKDSDIFICLFWTKAGEYTVEEFKVATNQYSATKKPVIYVYMKDNSTVTEKLSLTEFKEKLEKEMGHFPGRYTHLDTLKFDFLTKWIKFNPVLDFNAISVREETVYIHQTPTTINVSQLDFIRKNDEYADIIKKINKAKDRVRKYPNDEDFVNELRELKNRQSEFENSIIDTAIMISKLDNQRSSARLEKAIALFQDGDYKGAMSILNTDDIIDNIESNINNLDKLENIRFQYESNLRTHLDELMLKASLIVNSYNFNKFEETEKIYSYILSVLNKFNKDTQIEIMYEIAIAYNKSYNQSKAIELLDKLKNCDLDNRQKVMVLSMLGNIHLNLRNHHKANEYLFQAATICENDQYRGIPIPEIIDLIFLYILYARHHSLTEDTGYGEMINSLMSLSNQIYGIETNKENAIYHMYYSIYLIEQLGELEKGYQSLNKIQNALESIKTNDCKAQLAQLYQIYSQLYRKSDSPELFAQGYKYAIESMAIFRNMSHEEVFGNLNLYLESMIIASRYEDDNKNYICAKEIVTETLDRIYILPENRINSFNNQIIEIVFNGISSSLQSRADDESFELSWLTRYLPLTFTALHKTQYQSDLHSLFGKEYFIITSILKGINFDKDSTLRLKFDKLLIDLCDFEFSSYHDNENFVSIIAIGSILRLGKYTVSKSQYTEALHYTKVGLELINIIVKNNQEEPKSNIPLFIEAMVEMIPFLDIPNSQVKSQSFELLKEADDLFLQLKNMDEDTKDTYITHCNNLSLLAVQQKDINYGLDLILRALTLSPNNTGLWDTFGEICITINELDRVDQIVDKILSIDSSFFINNETTFAKYVKDNKLIS